jgi:hypothetical protein
VEVGIDPQQVGELIAAINSATSPGGSASAQPLVDGWMSQATTCGIDTTRLSGLNRDLAWAQEQIPMLRRRQSLALNLQAKNYDLGMGTGSGMVLAGAESLGRFPTIAAAQKAGREDAKAFKDGSMSLPELMQQLADNENDPDFCKAFFESLGVSDSIELSENSNFYKPDDLGAGQKVLATALATAMRDGYTLPDANQDGRVHLLAQLVSEATFPPKVLAQLGYYCMAAPAYSMYVDDVLRALAADPAAASIFLQHYSANIPYFVSQGPHSGLTDVTASELYNVIKAGTLGDQRINPQLANAAVQGLVTAYYESPGMHAYQPQFDALYDQIVAANWNSAEQAIADPAPVAGPGQINLTAKQWQAFISEGMRNSTAGAHLLAFAGQQAYQLALRNPDNLAQQHAAGVIQGFFGQTALNTYQQMVSDKDAAASSWQANFLTQLQAVAGAGVDVALDPQHAASAIAGDAVKDVLNVVLGAWVSSPNPPPPPPPSPGGWRSDWTTAAAEAYVANPNIGAPKTYEQQYCRGQPFLNSEGGLVAHADLRQREAYNAWLQDPAVSEAAGQQVSSSPTFSFSQTYGMLDLGRLDGEDEAGKVSS